MRTYHRQQTTTDNSYALIHSTTNTQPRAQLQVLVKASDDFEHAIFLKFRIGVSLWVEEYSHAL